MKHLVQAFLERELSRRDFAAALAALGLAAASVASVVRTAEAAEEAEALLAKPPRVKS